MQFSTRLKTFSPGLALASLLCVAAASAQTLVGVNATLDHNLESKTATAGQVVTAKLNDSVTTADCLRLPKGSELIGKVAEVKTSQNDGPSSVSLIFSTAKLKDGKEVPVKATVVAAYPSSDGDAEAYADQTIPPPPGRINGDTSVEQDAGGLSKVALNSAVKSSDSGTFSRANGDFRLTAGTHLQLGIAPAASGSNPAAAE